MCCVSKVIEKCVFEHVFSFLRDNSLIARFHSGFVPTDSTVSGHQLVEIFYTLCEANDSKKDVRIFFL